MSDVKLILGDFNAKVSCEDVNENIGKYGLHMECNDNDRRLVGFATSHGMMVGRTLFLHKDIHKATWKSPNGTHRNQIDHILIGGRHQSNLLDVQVFRGPNMDSDHYLVMGKMQGRICNANSEKYQWIKMYNIEWLKDERISKEYKEKLESTLQSVGTSDWVSCVKAVKRTAEETIGFEEKRQWKGWFDQECEKATQEKTLPTEEP
jgi:hypothetical protein